MMMRRPQLSRIICWLRQEKSDLRQAFFERRLFTENIHAEHGLIAGRCFALPTGKILDTGELPGGAGYLGQTFWSVIVTNSARPLDAGNRFFAVIVAACCLDAAREGHLLRAEVIAAIHANTVRHAGFALKRRKETVVRIGFWRPKQHHQQRRTTKDRINVANHDVNFMIRVKETKWSKAWGKFPHPILRISLILGLHVSGNRTKSP